MLKKLVTLLAAARQQMVLAAFALVVTAMSLPALAADPEYTSQIGDALGAVNMTGLIADVGAFSGMGFNLILTVAGVFFVAAILISFLRRGRG